MTFLLMWTRAKLRIISFDVIAARTNVPPVMG